MQEHHIFPVTKVVLLHQIEHAGHRLACVNGIEQDPLQLGHQAKRSADIVIEDSVPILQVVLIFCLEA